jgi:hypothetical protein
VNQRARRTDRLRRIGHKPLHRRVVTDIEGAGKNPGGGGDQPDRRNRGGQLFGRPTGKGQRDAEAREMQGGGAADTGGGAGDVDGIFDG